MREITVLPSQSGPSVEVHIAPRQNSTHALRLSTSELTRSIVVITAHGDIAVKFFGTEGLSVLHAINGALEQPRRMALVPSSAVTRVVRLWTPASTVGVAFDVDSALAAMQSQLRPVLRLVTGAD